MPWNPLSRRHHLKHFVFRRRMQTVKIDRLHACLVPFFHEKCQALPILVQGLHDRDHTAIEIASPLVSQANLFRTLFCL